jgi:4-hydroxy-tetrahydrodipicolinate synthase
MKDWARETVKGLWTSPLVPFTETGAIDHDGIRHNVEHVISLRADGIGYGFGEPLLQTVQERMDGFKTFADAVGGRVPCYFHGMDYSVPETIRLAEHAFECGADAVMLWVPLEWGTSEEQAVAWYEYMLDEIDGPVFLYNTYHSGLSLSVDAVARLAQHPNAVAFKDAVNDLPHTLAIMDRVGDQIVVSDPVEDHFAAMLNASDQQVLLGATSVYLMQSPDFQPVRKYLDLARAGDQRGMWEAYYDLQPLRDVWNRAYTVLWNKEAAAHPIAALKWWMDLFGMRGGDVRRPYRSFSQDERAAFQRELLATGWMERLFPNGLPEVEA